MFQRRTLVTSAAITGLVLWSGLSARTASTAEWAGTVFPVQKHEFGTVAVAAKTEFRFPVVNPYSSDLHIRAVRTSCGCTTAIVENEYIPAGESGSILARFNTDTFRGKRGATLTVVIDKPFYGEARLRVDGYIRKDMVFHPGELDFGKVEAGTSATKTATVFYAGRDDWKITDIQGSQPWIQADFRQLERGRGKANYELSVTLREDAPAGTLHDELLITTDDRAMPRVPFRITADIEAAITISPQLISLGSLKPGESIEQRLVVRGREPFVIEAIDCEGWTVEFEPTPTAKKLHILTTRFTPIDAAGPQKVKVVIRTTEEGERPVSANALLTAVVRDL